MSDAIKENAVVFKGNKNGITVVLDDRMDFQLLKDVLRRKVSDAHRFFGNSKTVITFKGRTLTDDEETQLLRVIFKESNLDVSFVEQQAETEKAALKSDPKAPEGPAEKPMGEKPENQIRELFSVNENVTFYHKGSLRSGQSIWFQGSVVVVGDVNPGGEVIAQGNVIVLGSLKGLVHAGSEGNDQCFVSALNLTPTQLRIGDIITYIPEEIIQKTAQKKGLPTPSYAYVQDGHIFIAPLMAVEGGKRR